MERLGVPRRIVSFVLPAGYTFNMDGTALYLALASVFVAQAAGIDMPVSRQVLMMLTLMLTSKGLAAVPRASLVILSGTLAQFGLPLEGVAVILGVDALMDMARTSVNVVGNCLATVVMARWDGAFPVPDAAARRRTRSIARSLPDDAADGARGRVHGARGSPASTRGVAARVGERRGVARLPAAAAHHEARRYWLSLGRSSEEAPGCSSPRTWRTVWPGTGQLALPSWPTARHRAELNKVMVATALRGTGHRPEPPASHPRLRLAARPLAARAQRPSRRPRRDLLPRGWAIGRPV